MLCGDHSPSSFPSLSFLMSLASVSVYHFPSFRFFPHLFPLSFCPICCSGAKVIYFLRFPFTENWESSVASAKRKISHEIWHIGQGGCMVFELKFPFLRNRVAVNWGNRGRISTTEPGAYIAEAYEEDDPFQKSVVNWEVSTEPPRRPNWEVSKWRTVHSFTVHPQHPGLGNS